MVRDGARWCAVDFLMVVWESERERVFDTLGCLLLQNTACTCLLWVSQRASKEPGHWRWNVLMRMDQSQACGSAYAYLHCKRGKELVLDGCELPLSPHRSRSPQHSITPAWMIAFLSHQTSTMSTINCLSCGLQMSSPIALTSSSMISTGPP